LGSVVDPSVGSPEYAPRALAPSRAEHHLEALPLLARVVRVRHREDHGGVLVCERDYLSRAAKQIAPLLAMFADWRSGECWPSQSQLAELSGMTTRSIRDAVKELERDLVLVVEKDATGRGSKRYRLLYGQVEPTAVHIARWGQEEEPEVPF
jgi:Helix-turn-helix domain